MEQRIYGSSIYVNISPEAFHLWATHYYNCRLDYKEPKGFSPVPYFLLCRSIELELKSMLLSIHTRKEVKHDFGHDLMSAYEALSEADKILSSDELLVLRNASEIYRRKGFEYFEPEDALRGYSTFPELTVLELITQKLVNLGR